MDPEIAQQILVVLVGIVVVGIVLTLVIGLTAVAIEGFKELGARLVAAVWMAIAVLICLICSAGAMPLGVALGVAGIGSTALVFLWLMAEGG